MEAEDARVDQPDVEATVEFAQYGLFNAARIWSESSPEQMRCLQKLISRPECSWRKALIEPVQLVWFSRIRRATRSEGSFGSQGQSWTNAASLSVL